MEPTNQVATTVQSAPSAMPTSVAPSSGVQYATSVPQTLQASAIPTTLPAQPVVTPTASIPQASVPQAAINQGNPWQEAFQALTASLNGSNPSQAPVSQSAYQRTPTPQVNTQAQWASQIPQQQALPQYSAHQISSHQALTPQQAQQLQAQQHQQRLVQQQQRVAANQRAGSPRDPYLSQITNESLEVLEHFGAEAPRLLNTYACAVEDALIEQVKRGQSQSLLLQAAGEERTAMNTILTNPDVLADYVNDFFGPNGPYPTPTLEELQQQKSQQARQQFEAEIQQQEQTQGVPRNFQRPEMVMPTPGRQANQVNNFWGGFSQLMDNKPEDAWKFLSQAPAQAFQQKMLVQDL